MIIDKIDRLSTYKALLPAIEPALAKFDSLTDWEEGVRYPFDGGFVFFQSGQTKALADAQFESHQKYVDVQLILAGSEYVALEDLANLKTLIPYDDERDVAKYDGPTKHYIQLEAGQGYIAFPWDAHKAVFHIENPLTFTKAVIKLEI